VTLVSSISYFESSNGGSRMGESTLDGASLVFNGASLDSSLGGSASKESSLEIS
jgi:hypothetical protein